MKELLTTMKPMPIYLSRDNFILAIPYVIRYKKMIEQSKYSLRLENFCRYIYTSSDSLYHIAPYIDIRPCILYAIYMCDDYRLNNPFITLAKAAYEYYFNKKVIPADFFIRYGFHLETRSSYSECSLIRYLNIFEAIRKEVLPFLLLEMSKEKAEEIVDKLCLKQFDEKWFDGMKNKKIVVLLISELFELFH